MDQNNALNGQDEVPEENQIVAIIIQKNALPIMRRRWNRFWKKKA